MKQLKHEAELVKAAILAGMKYGEERGRGRVMSRPIRMNEMNPNEIWVAGACAL